MAKIEKMQPDENSQLKKVLIWIMEKRIYFFSILASIVFLNIILYKLMPIFHKKRVDGSILTDQSYFDWKNSSYEDPKKLSELKSYIKKYPSLKPKYEGKIVQNILMKNTLLEADEKLAFSALDRTKEELPFYYEFAKVAILIGKKQYVKALDFSKDLKNKMLKDLSFLQNESLPAGAVLYSFNLLRIALLESKLKNVKAEILAWRELEDYLKIGSQEDLNDNLKIASKALKEIFTENDIELKDYIIYRKNSLSS